MAANKARVKELKNQITLEQKALMTFLETQSPVQENDTSTEEQKAEKQETFKAELAKHRAIVSTLKDELEDVKMNKNMSAYFQFIPGGGNRRQKKLARQLRKV